MFNLAVGQAIRIPLGYRGDDGYVYTWGRVLESLDMWISAVVSTDYDFRYTDKTKAKKLIPVTLKVTEVEPL